MAVDTSAYQGVATLVTAALFYLPPSIIAWLRRHPNRVSILFLNLLLGWTVIGWIVALIWSVSSIRRPIPDELGAAPAGVYQSLEQLAALKERGHLTQEEFEAEKAKILRGQ
ncbi:hypothetical protein CMV24_02225 [Pseudomonas plecoglossicida]|uniref:SHOCT domain-containing protein n=1 Tax=Pseudomonas plecoglossicida TaxID=70775 RepID=A0A2A3MBT1_PSEDL|nr:superinfection immunity protein [Pseudomonas plecoglossicida]PBJ97556.1 hypothetical protein CMV24_02225 [Pseudomonas plecoglossicida]